MAQYSVNEATKKKLLEILPYAIGAVLVVQFIGLGIWQAGRGIDKRAQQEAFEAQSGFTAWSDGMDVRPFQRLRASGRLDSSRQFLLENIVINGRLGYYVLTPLVLGDDEPVLMVNRGWLARNGEALDAATIAVTDSRISIRGRAGSLPRAGYRMGDPITPGSDWPLYAVYPTLDELAAALGQEVQPFVLLLDPQDDHGFFRHWVPEEMGPGRHFAYSLQWFAMGLVLAALLIWNYRKRGLTT